MAVSSFSIARLSLRTFLMAMLLASAARVYAQPTPHTIVYATGFSSPIGFVQDPSDRSTQFVVQQGGRIRTLRAGVLQPTSFLDLSGVISTGGERGLLGLAFAPDYVTSGRLYVNFTNTAGHTVVARFRRSANPLVADASSRFDLRWQGAGAPAYIAQPYSNHNGGHLAFGPDGFLYIGIGDGGDGGDPGHRAQNPLELLGKMLRVDVSVADADPIGYRIPPGNPFVGSSARPEIWSFGLRNPWRYSFDDPARGGTGALVMGDVGQGAWEEVDYEPAGAGGRNYGWRNREGAHAYDGSLPAAFSPLTDPIHEYDRASGQSITGGFVYRGHALGPLYKGRYFFADFVQGRVWSLGLSINTLTGEAQKTDVREHTSALGGSALGNISSFGVDADGELYLVSYSGVIRKILGPALDDFDGDGRSDLDIFRRAGGNRYIRYSSLGYSTSSATQWGLPEDVPVVADFDGDGYTELIAWRPSSGTWFIRYSSLGYTPTVYDTFQWGAVGDVPMAADFDGDGKAELAVWRPANGTWYIRYSSLGYSVLSHAAFQWGLPEDTPLAGDFDGDGRTELAVWRASAGTWYIRHSSSNYDVGSYVTYQWGQPGDIPLAGDFDGDGRTEIAAYRPSIGGWFVRRSTEGYSTATYAYYQWGLPFDEPMIRDFDGDGRADVAVFRPSNGQWFIRYSSLGYSSDQYGAYQWGAPGDVLVP